MKKTTPEDRDYTIEVVVDALAVLDVLCVDFAPMGIPEIMEQTGLSYDKVRRILITCERAGKVEVMADGKYRVGVDLLTLLHRFTRKELP